MREQSLLPIPLWYRVSSATTCIPWSSCDGTGSCILESPSAATSRIFGAPQARRDIQLRTLHKGQPRADSRHHDPESFPFEPSHHIAAVQGIRYDDPVMGEPADGELRDSSMQMIKHNPTGLFPQYRCYAHAVEIRGDSRLLIISGLNGFLADGKTMPVSFEEQADVIWTHIGTLLRSAGMAFNNIVSLRTYLADPADDEANVRMRVKYLGDHETASTVVCCRLLDPKWRLEIEAIAAA